jgi:hypothetical protein
VVKYKHVNQAGTEPVGPDAPSLHVWRDWMIPEIPVNRWEIKQNGVYMEPVKFEPGYYKINGVPDNRSPEWYLCPGANDDKFLWLSSTYETPLHQAQTHAMNATRRESRRDMVLTLSIAPEAGPLSREWNVTVDNEKCGILISGNCEFSGFHTVEFMGPPEMHTYEYRRQHESTELYRKLYSEAEHLCDSGDPRFRRSRRSGLVMYTGGWPRWHSDGSFWKGAHENSYLSFNSDVELAEQWEWIFNRGEWERKYKLSKG